MSFFISFWSLCKIKKENFKWDICNAFLLKMLYSLYNLQSYSIPWIVFLLELLLTHTHLLNSVLMLSKLKTGKFIVETILIILLQLIFYISFVSILQNRIIQFAHGNYAKNMKFSHFSTSVSPTLELKVLYIWSNDTILKFKQIQQNAIFRFLSVFQSNLFVFQL